MGNYSARWFDEVDDQNYVIPNLLVRPGQVIMHASGGVGKTSACLGLAKAVLSADQRVIFSRSFWFIGHHASP